MGKKGLLVVSFGTSHEDTRKKTIDKIEAALQESFPERCLYRAWTSGMIIKKLKGIGVNVDTVPEAMERMAADGITDVLVQPTHVLNGVENDIMQSQIQTLSEAFERVRFAAPLLTTEEDNEATVRILMDEFSAIGEETALVFMGHGTTHYVNPIYAAMDYRFKEMGKENFFMGTVEAYPTVESVMHFIRKKPQIRKVILTPFMIVAGDHAKNDMAGSEEDSWKRIFENAGYEVECVIRGLGEYEGIRRLFVEHARQAETEG